MSATVLDGRREASKILSRLQKQVARHRRPIVLASILVGQRFDSQLYIKLKTKAAERVGIETKHFSRPASTSTAQLLKLIRSLNRDRSVDGILLQLPLPKKINTQTVTTAISLQKDADGFRLGNTKVLPPTIAAVLHLFKMAKPKKNSRVLILGRDSVFTKRLQSELGSRAIIVAGKSSKRQTQSADIIITARGRGPRLQSSDIKKGVVMIDVGIRRLQGKTVGDVAPSALTKAKAISPVPGGVGPLTVAYLLYNTYRLATK